MFKLENVVRPHILSLKPYATARDEFEGEAQIFLDANENPHGGVIHGPFSRYPDPHQKALKRAAAKLKDVDPQQVFISHGSDEAIELIIRACCAPGRDAILVMPPTYTVYQVSAQIHDVAVIAAPLTREFAIDIAAVRAAITANTKLIFVCSPNNPTGTAQSLESIEVLCKEFGGLVVVDEAYGDFCPERSAIPLLSRYANLVVLQTLSKAWGLPALRIGLAFASAQFVAILSKVKAPYNISGPTQMLAQRALSQEKRKKRMAEEICREREKLAGLLAASPLVTEVVPSQANFLMARFTEPRRVYEELLKRGIIVRDRSNQLYCDGALRISVGTPLENRRLMAALTEIGGAGPTELIQDEASRRAVRRRSTNETAIEVDLNLDGSGETYVSTGLGFFDHMLQQLGKHSGADLSVAVQGDLDIDEPHTIEDTGITLGEALHAALGDKRGIERYGYCAPMDEAEASVTLDFSGRAVLVWDVQFKREYIGDVPAEMFKHFFHSLADGAKMTLHIRAAGENEHHIIEGIFKAFARALRSAIARTAGTAIPSTKGTL